MKRLLCFSLLALVLLSSLWLLTEGRARGDEKKIWFLKFKHDKPKRISIGEEEGGDIDVYWYMTYTLTNTDGDDHKIFINITAESDKGYKYVDTTQPLAKEKIKKRLQMGPDEKLFGKEDLTYSGKEEDLRAPFPRKLNLPVIKAGQTIRCVAIFHRWDPEMDSLVIKIQGLTNDVRIERTEIPNERKITETFLTLEYKRPGDEFYVTLDSLKYAGRKWIHVTRKIKTDLK